MGLLTLASTSAYARTSASQSNIGTATTLGRKTRVTGAQLLSIAPTGTQFLGIGQPTDIRLVVAGQSAGGNIIVALSGPGSANPSPLTISVSAASINSAELYTIRVWAGPGGCGINLRNAAGTEMAANTAAGVTVQANSAAHGQVLWGQFGSLPGSTGAIDGDAVYNQAPPDNIDAPRATDAGILWSVVDNVVGQLVSGATALDNLSGATWGAGGTWDPPAMEFEAAVSDSNPAQVDSVSAAFATAHDAVVSDVNPAQIDSVAAAFDGVAHSAAVSDANPAQADSALAGFVEQAHHSAAVVDSNPVQVDVVAAFGTEPGAHVWGVLGDSQTDEYQADDHNSRGGLTEWGDVWNNWLEMLSGANGGPGLAIHKRGLNFGPWGTRSEPRRTGYAYNWARSSSVMDNTPGSNPELVPDQLPGLVSQVENSIVTHAVLFVTSNEWMNYAPFWGPDVYNGTSTVAASSTTHAAIIAEISGSIITCIDGLVEAGAVGVVVVNLFDFAKHPGIFGTWSDPTRRGYVTSVINAIRGAVEAHAAGVNSDAGHTVVVCTEADRTLQSEVWPTADGQYVTMAGVQIDYTTNDDYSPYRLAAGGHAGPILSGYYANDFVAAANQLPGVSIAPYTAAEILENAGIEVDHEASVSDTNPVQIDSVAGLLSLEHAGSVTDQNPVQSDAAAVLHETPEHAASVADPNPAQQDSAAVEFATAHGAGVTDANPSQVDSVAGTFATVGQSASVTDANPPQTDAAGITLATVQHTAAVSDLNPAQVDAVAALFSEVAHSAQVGDTNPPQSDAVVAEMVPSHAATVADQNPAQADDVDGLHDAPAWLLEILDNNPAQVDIVAAWQSVADCTADVTDFNPGQTDGATAVMIAPAFAAVADTNPDQVDGVDATHSPLVPIPPYHATFTVSRKGHGLSVAGNGHTITVEG